MTGVDRRGGVRVLGPLHNPHSNRDPHRERRQPDAAGSSRGPDPRRGPGPSRGPGPARGGGPGRGPGGPQRGPDSPRGREGERGRGAPHGPTGSGSASPRPAAPVPQTPPAPKAPVAPRELGWLPDCVYTGEKFETGLAFFVDAAGRIARFSREPADLEMAKRLPGQAALPGLVNTHSQAWQRIFRGRLELRAAREAADRVIARLTEEDIYDAAKQTFIEMLLAGITTVGECHHLHPAPDGSPLAEPGVFAQAVLRAARDAGIRIALLHGAAFRGGFGQPVGSAAPRAGFSSVDACVRTLDQLQAWVEKNLPGDDVWLGLAPRSLGAVPLDALKALAAYAHAKRFRVHLALGETAGEAAACQAEFGRAPAALLAEHGLLDKRFTALHATHVADDEVRVLGGARVTVCACPGTELAAGEGHLPVARLVAAGCPLALGTDRQGQTHLLEEARLLAATWRAEPARPADLAATLFQAATVTGARSLGAPGGALEVGRPADFFTVNLYDSSLVGAGPEGLLAAVVWSATPRAVREVWVGGNPRVSGWKHPLQSAVVGRFAELQKKLWAP